MSDDTKKFDPLPGLRFVARTETSWEMALLASSAVELIESLTQRLAAAKAALQRLMDVQNGPPLIRDTQEWNEAMCEACRVVGNDKAAEYYEQQAGGGE